MCRFSRFVFILILLLPQILWAANPRLLRFDDPVHDIGTVKEVDGVVVLRYPYTNVCDQPVTILDIHTQCGCVQTEYDSKPIRPGENGIVEVHFDPKDRLDDFNIGITLIASNGAYRKFNTLTVKGSVISRIPTEEIRYPYALSAALRTDLRTIGMRQIRRKDPPRIKRLRLFNSSDKTMQLTCLTGSQYIAILSPRQIAARQEAVLNVMLDPRAMPTGKFVFRVILQTADAQIPIEIKGQIID